MLAPFLRGAALLQVAVRGAGIVFSPVIGSNVEQNAVTGSVLFLSDILSAYDIGDRGRGGCAADLLFVFDVCRQRLSLLVGNHMQAVCVLSADVIVADRIAVGVQRHWRVYRLSVLVIREERDA